MKNRKREICTSGSVRDEDGQPPHLLGRRKFLHLAAGAATLSPCRASHGRKPIRRGRSGWLSPFRRAVKGFGFVAQDRGGKDVFVHVSRRVWSIRCHCDQTMRS
jgi:hypothetical protein